MASALYFVFNLMFIMILAIIPVVVILRIAEMFLGKARKVRKRF